MEIKVFLSLLSCLSCGISVAQNPKQMIIDLTDIDSTYVMNGNLINSLDSVIVSGGNLDDFIYVIPYFVKQEDTNFFLFDVNNVAISSLSLVPLQTFQQHCSIDFSKNTNFDFALIFKRFPKTDEDKVKNFDFDTIPLRVTDTNELAEAYTMKATNRPHLYTVFNPLNQIYQWAFLTPKTISPNCVVSLFAGGYPSDKGSEKYRIYDFDANNLPSFSNGFMSTFGFTFFIPSQCEFSILINANGAPPNTELMFAMHTGNEGFFMSNGYRQMDNLQQNQPFIYNLGLYNDDWNQNVTKFFFEVVDFNAGDLNDTSFFISYGNNDDDIMLEQSISNQNFSSHTVMAQLRYDAMTDHSYVFVRYKTLGDGTDEEPTTTSASTTASASTPFQTTPKSTKRSQYFALSTLVLLLFLKD